MSQAPPAYNVNQPLPPQGQPSPYPPAPQGQGVAYPPPVMQGPQTTVYMPPQPSTVVYTAPAPPVQTTYVYQGSNDGCCSGESERFNAKAGLVTGIIQLVVGVLSIILTGASYAFATYNASYGIWGSIIFFIPAGILGIVSKGRRTALIISYMVMSILATFNSFGMIAYESVAAAVYAYISSCYTYFDGLSWSSNCDSQLSTGAVAVHSVLAILALVEFVVSIVASAYCCGGLACCCAGQPSTATTTATTYQARPQDVVVTTVPMPANDQQYAKQ